jgi:hypothetical protein
LRTGSHLLDLLGCLTIHHVLTNILKKKPGRSRVRKKDYTYYIWTAEEVCLPWMRPPFMSPSY